MVKQESFLMFYCPTCGEHGMVEYYQVLDSTKSPSWDKGKVELTFPSALLFKAEPSMNNGVMSLKNAQCQFGKATAPWSASVTLSLNYHFYHRDGMSEWKSFAKLIKHKELPDSTVFQLAKTARQSLVSCRRMWSR